MCYQHVMVEEKISSLESRVAIKSIYNEKLFNLYLKYIRRYRLHYAHLKQTQKLVDLLTTTEIATIRSWKDIYRLDQKYFYPNTILKNNGSAFLKIGQMLEEVGLLPPKELEKAFLSILSYFLIIIVLTVFSILTLSVRE